MSSGLTCFADTGWKWFWLILFHFQNVKLKIMKHQQKHNKFVQKSVSVSCIPIPQVMFLQTQSDTFFHCFLSDFYRNPNNDWFFFFFGGKQWLVDYITFKSLHFYHQKKKNKLFARILVHKLRLHRLKNYLINPNQDFWILMITLLPNNIY